MEESSTVLAPPARLFERLSLLANYTWDQTCFPFHSVSKRSPRPNRKPLTVLLELR